ncbi:MAG: AAA family ATPase [Acidimicrobiales bacterium]
MILLLTPEESFVPFLQGLVGDTVDISRQWDETWKEAQAIEVVRATSSPAPDVVIIGPSVPEAVALEWAGAFDREHPDVGTLIIAPATPDLLMGAMRLGVREVVPPNASGDQIREAVERLLTAASRLKSSRPVGETLVRSNRVITVLSAKGGSGKTVVATNLALGLNDHAPGEVVLVDLDIQFGDCGSTMNLEPEQTLADAALNASVLDATTLKVFLTPHPSGLFLLGPPQSLVDAAEVTAQQIKSILDLLVGIFEYVVIDTSSGIDDHAITAMEFSTDLLLVSSSEVPSVRAMRRQVETLDTIGMTRQDRHFVVNRAGTRVGLRTSDIEQTVGMEASIEIPSSRQVVISTNQGQPIVVSAPKDPAARAMKEMVDMFRPTDADDAPNKRARKGKR